MGAYGAAVWLLAGRRAARREERARDEAFEHQLLHDDLTKLPNRTLFATASSARWRGAFAAVRLCAVLSIDVDRFKLVTDGLGRQPATTCCARSPPAWTSCIRPEDTVARTGGDEFMLLLESVTALEDATAVADRVSAALASPVKTDAARCS